MIELYDITRDVELFKKYFKCKNQVELNSYFREAAFYGYLPLVKYLVSVGANINSVDDTALFWAANKGNLSMVKWLVENGANIFAKDNCIIQTAIQTSHFEVVEYLQSKGAKL